MTTMRSLNTGLLALTLAFGGAGVASADQYQRGHDRHGYSTPSHSNHGSSSHPSHHRNSNNLLAAIVITGLIGAAVVHASTPAPVYVAPVVAPPAPPPQRMWHYCASSGQYYPYTRFCPEGWQVVAPRASW